MPDANVPTAHLTPSAEPSLLSTLLDAGNRLEIAICERDSQEEQSIEDAKDRLWSLIRYLEALADLTCREAYTFQMIQVKLGQLRRQNTLCTRELREIQFPEPDESTLSWNASRDRMPL